MYFTPEEQATSPTTPSEQLKKLAKESIELARLVATNPNLTPELFQDLASSWDIVTIQNVAANPNTPIEVLQKLADNFVREIMEFRRYVVRRTIAANSNTSVEILEKILDYAIKQQKVGYFNVESHYCELDDFISLDDIPEVIARNPKTPAHLFEKLAAFERNIRINSIWFSVSSEEIKYRLGVAIAKHANTPGNVLESLAYSETEYIRECVATEQSKTNCI